MLTEYATFSTANMIASNKFNIPDFGMMITGALISLLGLTIGFAINHFQKNRNIL